MSIATQVLDKTIRKSLQLCRARFRSRCRGRLPWPGSHNRKGDHSRASSVRSVQAAQPSSEVVVPKADSLVGAGVSLDRLRCARACGNVKNLSLLTGYTVGGRRPAVMNMF